MINVGVLYIYTSPMVAMAKHSKRPIFFGETRFSICFPLRTELNLSNAGLVPCGPDGKSHAFSFGGSNP